HFPPFSHVIVARCAQCGHVNDLTETRQFCAFCGWRMRPTDLPVNPPPLDREPAPDAGVDDAQRSESGRTAPTRTPPPAARALRTAPCPHCGRAVARTLYFCNHCGLPTGFASSRPSACPSCGERVDSDEARFCRYCGTALLGGADEPRLAASTRPRGVPPVAFVPTQGPRLVLLDEHGGVVREIPIEREVTIVGRTAGDLT